MDAIPFLDKIAKLPVKPFYVLHGDEDFLKRQIKLALIPRVIGDSDPDFAIANYLGEQVEFSSIRNELDTLPFLCERRLIFIDQADTFVTKYRSSLEAFAVKPSNTGVLVLDVKSFPATTKLFKAVPDECNLVCKAYTIYNSAKLIPWITSWAKKEHGKKMGTGAADLLIENAGIQMGLLAQELSKLATFVNEKTTIEREDVDKIVGRSRAANAFKILDAVGNADGKAALTILHELFEEGEEAIGILGAMGVQLRRLAQIGYYINRKVPIGVAMDQAKIPAWPQARQTAEKQIRHLGRNRLGQIYGWLVETDLGLKGGSPLPPRLQMEKLIVKMARPRA